jgi:type II secretory pathway pseudopilin PulG
MRLVAARAITFRTLTQPPAAMATPDARVYISISDRAPPARIRPNACRMGLTLAEMLIVLLILSVLTLVAVQSMQPLAEQARYEATRTTLDRTEEAIMGPEGMRQTDGTPILSGFVADVGRLPMIAPGAPPGFELAELWNPTSPLALSFPYGVRAGPASFDGEDFRMIRIPCGWRGPYLQPTAGLGLRDGWGKPLLYDMEPDSQEGFWANEWHGLAMRADLTLELPTATDLPRVMTLVTLIGHVAYDDGTLAVGGAGQNLDVDVYLVYPDPERSIGELSVVRFPVTAENPDFIFTSVAPGLRALRAVVRQNEVTLADKTVYRHVLRSGLSDLRIQLDSPPPEPMPDPDPEPEDP